MKIKISISVTLERRTLKDLSKVLQAAIISKKAKTYSKFGSIKAVIVGKSQKVDTIIDGVLETTNTAVPGDYIITGPRREEYVVKAETFKKRYVPVSGDTYKPIGKVVAIKWVLPPTTFTASWGEDMILNTGDMLCATPDNLKEPYRIEIKAFRDTYK